MKSKLIRVRISKYSWQGRRAAPSAPQADKRFRRV